MKSKSARLPIRLFAAAAAASITLAACSKSSSDQTQQSANGSLDTASLRTGADVPAEGPAVQVTRTDDKSVTRSTQYELTPGNFTHFVAAADSIAALEARDSTARAYLSQDITDAGANELDAGRKWLDANPSVSAAINTAGISTEDYFVQSIAIASAERFMSDPKAAPPTPSLTKNAEFLRGHQAELAHLQSLRSGKPAVVSTP